MKQAAVKSEPAHREEMSRIIEEIETTLAQPDSNDEKERWKFHFAISEVVCRAAKSPRLASMLDDLADYIRSFVQLGYDLPGRQRKATEEHLDLIKAIRDGEADLAEHLTKIHVENSKKAYLEALSKQ
jgi:DNA-binding GntR family transcriptional regulator